MRLEHSHLLSQHALRRLETQWDSLFLYLNTMTSRRESNEGQHTPAYSNDKISRLHEQLGDVQRVMQQNAQLALHRTEQLEDLDEKAKRLELDSQRVLDGTNAVRRHFCCQHWRNILIIGLSLAVLFGIIIFWQVWPN